MAVRAKASTLRLITPSRRNTAVTSVLAEIAISAAPLFIGTGIFYALVAPVALITRPFRYLSVRRAFLNAKTPRQRFQALFPQTVTRTAVVSCLLMLCFSAFIYAFIQPLVLVPVAAFSILLLPPVRLDVHYGMFLVDTGLCIHPPENDQSLMPFRLQSPFAPPNLGGYTN